MNIEILINKLIEYYNVKTITELAIKLDTTQSTISGWRARNAIGALADKVASIDSQALSFIFASSSQKIEDNHGQVAQNVNGDQNFTPATAVKKDDNIDAGTYNLFLEAYLKAQKNDDLKGFRVYLMDY